MRKTERHLAGIAETVVIARTSLVSFIRLSLVFVNSPRRESGRRGVVSLLFAFTTPSYVGVPVKRQQPISVIFEKLHNTFLPGLIFQSDCCCQYNQS